MKYARIENMSVCCNVNEINRNVVALVIMSIKYCLCMDIIYFILSCPFK